MAQWTHVFMGRQEQVQNNKDLDLPTQQELLAQFRCDEIAAAALSEFNEQAKPQRRPIETGKVVDGLGGMMKGWRSGTLGEYSFILLLCARCADGLMVCLISTL